MAVVAANFIRRGMLRIGPHEMSITKFTGNVHEFPPSINDDERRTELSQLVTEHTGDVNAQFSDKRPLEGMLACRVSRHYCFL